MLVRLLVLVAVAAGVVASCGDPPAGAPPRSSDPDAFTGRVSRVVDGDTFWLDSQPVSVRVFGLDAPERGKPGGSAATMALTQLIAGERVACRERDIDRYGRIVGQCFLPDGAT